MKCPILTKVAVYADNPHLAAQVSCAFGERGHYLPVIDGPRMQRPDRDAEVTRRNNAAARIAPDLILLCGLDEVSKAALQTNFKRSRTISVENLDNLWAANPPMKADAPRLRWGQDKVAYGLLTALRAGAMIEFGDGPSPQEPIASVSGHLVVVEEGDQLAEVIAANYAHALSAGLVVIPEVDAQLCDDLMEEFYNAQGNPKLSTTETLAALRKTLRDHCGDLALPDGSSITFFTQSLPFGFAFGERPSTHLFRYPDLGITVVNGFAAEQPHTRGINVAVLVDPGQVAAPEMAVAAKSLGDRKIFVRGYSEAGATTRNITDVVDNFPYDLLIFATHCGDPDGYRWTYEFEDSEGIARRLVVDIALGLASTDDPEMLEVTQLMRFHSLDGVDWTDREAKKAHYIGTAIKDFTDLSREEKLAPVDKENIDRVVGAAALQMYGSNYVPALQSIAANETPIVINNSCVSWHELAKRFTFANARAYVGTLFSVTNIESAEVIGPVLQKHFGKPLPHALWAAQNAVYGKSVRRPYVATGVYPQKLRTTQHDTPRFLVNHFAEGFKFWSKRLAQVEATDDKGMADRIRHLVDYNRKERSWLAGKYLRKNAPRP